MQTESDLWNRYNPFGASGPFGSRRPTAADSRMRVSDAERNVVGDALSRHYADGRLTEAEFRERFDLAMAAKTRLDLSGLLTDLPPFPESGETPTPPPPPRRSRLGPVAIFVVALIVAGWATTAITHFFWLPLIVFGAFLLCRRGCRHRYHVGPPSQI